MAKKPLELVTEQPAPDVGPTPPGLGEHGARMWTSVLREFNVSDIGGRLLLEQACHAADMVVRLRAQIDQDGLMVEMQTGKRTHPAVKEELGYRAFICATLKRLGIIDEPIQQFGGAAKRYGLA